MSTRLMGQMLWRRALKRFAPCEPNEVDVTRILEAARLAPTANGLQPFNIHVITEQNLKRRIRSVSYNQAQVTECSHLMIFSHSTNPKLSVERFINAFNLETEDPVYAKKLRETFLSMTNEEFSQIAANQTHIALGFSLAAAADLGIASCPMGGFEPEKVHAELDLDDSEMPVVFLAVGKQLEGPEWEKLSTPFPKRRLPIESFIRFYS